MSLQSCPLGFGVGLLLFDFLCFFTEGQNLSVWGGLFCSAREKENLTLNIKSNASFYPDPTPSTG